VRAWRFVLAAHPRPSFVATLTQVPPKRGRRSAGRRVFWKPHRRVRQPPPYPPSPSLGKMLKHPRRIRRGLVSRRSTAALATQINAMAQPGPCFLGRAASGRYSPPLSQSSEAPRGPVVMPADAIPGPPGSGVTSPARRNRTRPINRLSPVTSLDGRDFGKVTNTGTNVKAAVALIVTTKTRGSSCSRLSRASTSSLRAVKQDVDGRNESGHDSVGNR
jgi:hypothetical protein